MFSKKTFWFFILNFFVLIINLIINWILTPRIGYYGAITAFLVSSFFQVLILLIIQQKVIPIKWNYKKMLYFPISIIAVASLLEIVKFVYNTNAFIIALILTGFIFAGLAIIYKNELTGVLNIFWKNYFARTPDSNKQIN